MPASGTEATAAPSEQAAAAPLQVAGPAREPWNGRLRHGLILTNGRDVRLFGEPAEGQWSVQSVTPDLKTAGEPWSTFHDKWLASDWTEVPNTGLAPAVSYWRDASRSSAMSSAQDRTMALPGMGDVVPPSQESTKPAGVSIALYVPDAKMFKAWTERLSTAERPVTEDAVRACFAEWQQANAGKSAPNPGAQFWHFAKKALAA
jgi:hypothetical protein